MGKIWKFMYMITFFVIMSVALPSCGGDDEPNDEPTVEASDDSRIYGTWEGKFFDDTFVLTFSKDGKYTEVVDGDRGVFSYTLNNGNLTIIPDNSALNNIMGNDIKVKFKSSTSMSIECNLWKMDMTKK